MLSSPFALSFSVPLRLLCLDRFERKDFKLVGLKQLTPSRELAGSHAGMHHQRFFCAGFVESSTSGPVGPEIPSSLR